MDSFIEIYNYNHRKNIAEDAKKKKKVIFLSVFSHSKY